MIQYCYNKMKNTALLCVILTTLTEFSHEIPLEARYGGYVFEGDMILPKKTIEVALRGGDVSGASTVKSNKQVSGKPNAAPVTAHNSYRWPGGVVPYEIDSKLKCSKFFWKCTFYGAEDVIKKAIKDWEKNTCVRFKKRTNEQDYVRFINDRWWKCYSNVGRTGGRQVIALGRFCRKKGIVIHEIGHALGLYHEQSRPDRDDYVQINYGNIKSGAESNFKRYTHSQVNDLGFPYDYGSIMHYGKHAFAKWPWRTTIKPKQRGAKIGQRDGLSNIDIAEMKKYYQC